MAFWDKLSNRGRVEDRRGMGTVGQLGIGGLALVAVVTLISGGNLGDVVMNVLNTAPLGVSTTDTSQFEGEDTYEVFTSTVLGSANNMWNEHFRILGVTYREPTLVLFRGATESACGYAASEVGPHYCPNDETIYLDETFFDELTTRLGAQGGDVAQAYVIAHEVGHHAQNQLGLLESSTNEDSMRVELQADCFAGLWANSVRDKGVFEVGEIEEAMDAAAAVGDDRIQERVQGRVNPETWTHGSSAERVEAFNKGYGSGDFVACQ